MSLPPGAADVFSVQEIARAAGVRVPDVERAIESHAIRCADDFVAAAQAVRCVRLLRREGERIAAPRPLFAPPPRGERSPGAGVAASTAIHGGVFAMLMLLAALGVQTHHEKPRQALESPRLVFLPTPGPGGGGGGGGLRQPSPPPRAELKTAAKVRSPVPPPRPATRRPDPPVRPAPAPPVLAQAPP
ncbi:MAG TPA: hypothetical protein VM364_05440, partial [Vicinamibacterales bacterium]|nr:hypothetical protein [Vicinamibacterales bacterium]